MFTSRVIRAGLVVLGCAAVLVCIGACSQNKAPTVVATTPEAGATDVPTNQAIVVTFSREMDAATISEDTFTLTRDTTPVAGTVSISGDKATFTPEGSLAPNTLYTATIKSGVESLKILGPFNNTPPSDSTPENNTAIFGQRDIEYQDGCDVGPLCWIGGISVASILTGVIAGLGCNGTAPPTALETDFVWTFTTAGSADGTAPTVSSTFPANGATGVPLSTNLSAVFSEQMDAETITTATFMLARGTTSVSGTVSYAGVTAIFNPNSALAPNTLYTATITTGATDLSGAALANNYVWTFTTSAAADTTAPTVSSTYPENRAVGVPTGGSLSVTFSEGMNPLTITTATFTLMQGTTPISGTVTPAGVTAIFSPESDLAFSTQYTATITTGVQDLSGNALAANYVWTFTTGAEPDTTRPTVISTNPADAATDVALNKKISAVFSEAMNPLTITAATFTLAHGTTPVSGTVSYAGVTALFTPASELEESTLYTATITSDAKDLAGNALASNYVWTFTTGVAPDITPPTVISTFPEDGVVGVPIARHLNVIFSEVMSPLTVSTATFLLHQGATPISGTVDQAGAVAVFTPTDSLLANTEYTGTITTGVEDLAGNAMVSDYVWTFTTGATTAQDSIDLGSAAAFAILAGSTVENTGNSTVAGDLGVSPGTAVVGFPPGVLDGSEFTGVGSAAGEAKLDLTTAFNDAAGRTDGPISLAGDLSGLTLYPGLYANSTSVMLSAGTVTLDALGDPDAVFIFQMGSTLTTEAGTQVILAGDAKAANIYWQVGSSASLGTTSIFKGNILAQESITLATGATLEGRALTQTAAVTLDAAVIAVPVP